MNSPRFGRQASCESAFEKPPSRVMETPISDVTVSLPMTVAPATRRRRRELAHNAAVALWLPAVHA
jgi:hypothetical protein